MASVGERAAANAAALESSEAARGETTVRAAALDAELAAMTERAGRAETVVTTLQEQLDQAHDVTSQQTAQLKQAGCWLCCRFSRIIHCSNVHAARQHLQAWRQRAATSDLITFVTAHPLRRWARRQ